MSQQYSKDSLGTRMKGYENTSKTFLQRRTPVIIRVDGKAFHTWTKRLKAFDTSLKEGPFSNVMYQAMSYTSNAMLRVIQNAELAYTQSDEISILLKDWHTYKTDQWYNGNVQKIASVSASITTAAFNKYMREPVYDLMDDLALFDARVFNLPKEDVTNYFIWRQKDATRNSINMLAQFYFSHKELQGKNVSQVQDMLMTKGVNWNNLEVWKKRGSVFVPKKDFSETPIFSRDRDFIENILHSNNV